jgi:hypothetical protein
MNDIDEFLKVMLAMFIGIVLLMIVLTYLETTLVEPLRPRRRMLRKKLTAGMDR